jgi:hypothetical protein
LTTAAVVLRNKQKQFDLSIGIERLESTRKVFFTLLATECGGAAKKQGKQMIVLASKRRKHKPKQKQILRFRNFYHRAMMQYRLSMLDVPSIIVC